MKVSLKKLSAEAFDKFAKLSPKEQERQADEYMRSFIKEIGLDRDRVIIATPEQVMQLELDDHQ